MRAVVFGGRDFTNEKLAFKALDMLHKKYKFTTIIDGAARGADTLGYRWAKLRGVKTLRFAANWKKYGAWAGPLRNKRMIEDGQPEIGIAFPGGKGTANMKEQMKKAGIKILNVVPVTYNRGT